ncbi:MAG TPA: COP23 domain-containing protein [Oculatellaceae cyanobacterium]|jgi:hypothetical protein
MKFQPLFLAGIVATSATLNLSAMPTLSQSDSNQVKFLCNQVFDPASGDRIPATVAWVPERQKHILIVGWKSTYFPKWNPEKRCQEITRKFQAAYNDGRLDYLTTGEINSYQVICAVTKQGNQCDGNNQLFTIKRHEDPNFVLSKLLGSLDGKSNTIIYQSAGSQKYISFNEILQKAPIVPEKSISFK